jgi:hypothetical protein
MGTNFKIRIAQRILGNWEKLAVSKSGAQMELIDAKKCQKKSRGTVPL